MRWLLVSSQHHPSHGGIGAYVARFMAAAVEAGWEIDLVTRPSLLHPVRATVHEIATTDMDESFAGRLQRLRRIERIRPYRYALWSRAVAEKLLHIDKAFDVIEFVDCQAEGYASLCSSRVRQRFPGVPMIVHAHTPMFVEEAINHADANRFGRSIYHNWERQALWAADGVITTSKLLADRLPRVKNIRVMPYPIASEPFDQLSAAFKTKSILLIGSVQPRKGVEIWARSLNRVLRKHPDASAILIGPDTATGPNGQSMSEHLWQLLDPQVRDRLRITGNVPHADVQRMITEASLVVVPSLFESFSFVAAEALLRGVPVIVSEQVGIAEHVQGLKMVPVGDVKSLAAAQLEVLDDVAAARRQTVACRERMLEACSPARHLQQRISFIDAISSCPSEPIVDPTHTDALEEIDEFTSSVERMERSSGMASSVRS